MQILTVSGLRKTYTTRFGGSNVQALKNVNFTVEFWRIRRHHGRERQRQDDAAEHPRRARQAHRRRRYCSTARTSPNIREKETAAAFRRDNLGFVFQDFNLLDTFSLAGQHLPAARARWQVVHGDARRGSHRSPTTARHFETLLKKYPYEVSGGQKQRAAVRPRAHHPPADSCWPTSRPARSTPARPTSS